MHKPSPTARRTVGNPGLALIAMGFALFAGLGAAGALAETAKPAPSTASALLDQVQQGVMAPSGPKYPFSFTYNGQSSDQLLDNWKKESKSEKLDDQRHQTVTFWADPASGLRVEWEAIRFNNYPAADWVLHFENTGTADTPIIENIQALNLSLSSPLSGQTPYRLWRTKGAPSNPTDFEVSAVAVAPKSPQSMGGGGGRSSNRDFPFFKIETGAGSIIIAVGWSGQWQSRLECPDPRSLRVTAGMELTHFKLHPAEKVRSPRILLTDWKGDTLESNAGFRQLIYKHYAATRNGQKPSPTLFCNRV